MKALRPLATSLVLLVGLDASAYRAATHAGLTEEAALTSNLHLLLIQEFGRPLGLYESLAVERDEELWQRLAELDPEGGYTPVDGKQSALGWLMAGAVLEGVPAERSGNHFFDPVHRRGLEEGGGLHTRLSDVVERTGSVRSLFTGTSFDGRGLPSLSWLHAPRNVNAWGFVRFAEELERAFSATRPALRSAALARALLCAGAIAHLLEDAGDPAYVRNDYRVELEEKGGPYERFVEERFGRMLPMPSAVKEDEEAAESLDELFTSTDGHGLADRTHQHFFSAGTLPGSGLTVPPVEAALVAPNGDAAGYVAGEVAHLVRYERVDNAANLRWSLDERCYRDYAQRLLPEIERAVVRALALLFADRLALSVEENQLKAWLKTGDLAGGTVTIYADTASGERKPLLRRTIGAAHANDELIRVERPSWAAHATVLFVGKSGAGQPTVLGHEQPVR